MASCRSFGRVFSVFTEKQIGRIDTACWVRLRCGGDFVELHGFDAGGLVLAGRDHAVLNGVVYFVVRNHRRGHADRRERLRPDRRTLHAHLEALEIGEVLERLVGEDVPDAAAGIADQHHLGLGRDLIGDRRQNIRFDHLVHVLDALEHEGSVDERRRLGKGRHVGRRHNAIVDRLALPTCTRNIAFRALAMNSCAT